MNLNHLGEFDRVYTYARVSSSEQGDDKRNSIETQDRRLGSVSPTPTKVFRDIQSGDTPDRPDFNAMLTQVRADALAGLRVLVVVTEQSRLSRDSNVAALIEGFDAIDVCVFALDGGRLTTKEPHEWLSVATTGIYNQYFLRQHRRVLRASKAQRRSEGRPVSCRPPFGFVYTRDKFILDPLNAEIGRKVVGKFLPPPYGAGLSLRKCAAFAKSIGWDISHSGLKPWLINPVLRGHTEYSEGGANREDAKRGLYSTKKPKVLRLDTHEALITESEYQLIIRRLAENKQFARVHSNVAREPMSGLIVCGNCQVSMHFNTVRDRVYDRTYYNYVCNNLECPKPVCASVRFLEPKLQEAIAARAATLATMVAESEAEPVIDPEVLAWERQLKDLRQMHDRSPMTGLRLAIEELEQKIVGKTNAAPKTNHVLDLKDVISVFCDPSNFDRLSKEKKRIMYHDLVESVTVSREGGKRSPLSITVTLLF